MWLTAYLIRREEIPVTHPATELPGLDEPTDEEIAAAAADEAAADEAAARALQSVPSVPATEQPARRGPGRPPGAKNKPKGQAAARQRARTTRVEPQRPAGNTPPPIDREAEREAAKKEREEHKATVNAVVAEAMQYRPNVVKGIGLVTGLPQQFLVGVQLGDDNNPIFVDGQPVIGLTEYGQMLAPQEWQVRAAVEAGVRVMESEQGERLIELWEKVAPYVYGGAALGALGLYTVTVLKTVEAIKPMIAQQLAQMQAAQQQQAPGGGSSAEPPTG